MNKKDRIHDWRKLKWPFTAPFLYYSLLSLYTGRAERAGLSRHVPHGFDRGRRGVFFLLLFPLQKRGEHAEALVRLHSGLCAHLHTAALHPLADDDGACDRRVSVFFF